MDWSSDRAGGSRSGDGLMLQSRRPEQGEVMCLVRPFVVPFAGVGGTWRWLLGGLTTETVPKCAKPASQPLPLFLPGRAWTRRSRLKRVECLMVPRFAESALCRASPAWETYLAGTCTVVTVIGISLNLIRLHSNLSSLNMVPLPMALALKKTARI